MSDMVIPEKRPKVTVGKTHKSSTGCGNLYVTVNRLPDARIFEVFSTLGKTGNCAASQTEGICRLASLALRSCVDPASIAKQLTGIRCGSPGLDEGQPVLSCCDAIAKVLQKEIDSTPLTPGV